jgi:hypothetical protein
MEVSGQLLVETALFPGKQNLGDHCIKSAPGPFWSWGEEKYMKTNAGIRAPVE